MSEQSLIEQVVVAALAEHLTTVYRVSECFRTHSNNLIVRDRSFGQMIIIVYMGAQLLELSIGHTTPYRLGQNWYEKYDLREPDSVDKLFNRLDEIINTS